MIDQELYVDGGVTGNIQYGGRRGEENTIPAIWQKLYPELPIPKIRMWVIFNNQFRPVPEVTVPNWVAVIQRSLDTASRAATATAVRHLYTMAEVARLKRNVDAEVRVVSIPGDWYPPLAGTLLEENTNKLTHPGKKKSADPPALSDTPPHSFATHTRTPTCFPPPHPPLP